jgi:hypothetical protein
MNGLSSNAAACAQNDHILAPQRSNGRVHVLPRLPICLAMHWRQRSVAKLIGAGEIAGGVQGRAAPVVSNYTDDARKAPDSVMSPGS